jgi:hypothetical protein
MEDEESTRVTDENQEFDDLRVPDGRVLVHIGPHKTGTTSLQAALFAARPELLAQGVRHAGWGRNPARAVQAVTGQPSAYSDFPPPEDEWRALVRHVGRNPRGRVILSSEFLAHARPDVVRRVVDDLGRDRVHVVTTLRPLARLLPSMWQQNVKAGRRIGFDAWLHRVFPESGGGAEGFWTLHRHDALIARWAAEVGADRVTAVVVDETDREMLLRTFERLLGVRPGTLRPVPGLANRSITVEEAEAIRAYNIAHRRAGLGKAAHALVMRYGAAQYLGGLDPTPGGHAIHLPAWAIEPVGIAAEGIVRGIEASGVRVVGDLASLAWMPAAPAPEEECMSDDVPAEVAARIAMGIVVASGLTRADGAVPESALARVFQTVSSRQLAAVLGTRTRLAAGRRARRWLRLGRAAAARLLGRVHHEAGTPVAATQAAPALLPPGSIVLHIGPPKTGTTAVQAAFHACRHEVARQGVHYAGRRRHSIAAVQAALGGRSIRGDATPPLAAWHRLRDEIRSSRAGRIVLSSEFFADAKPDRIRAVVEELGRDRVQVVVTLRPLARIIPSQWQQYVQSGMRMGYGPWLDALLNRPEGTVSPTFWHRHHVERLIARWADVVGPDRVTAIVLDESDRELVLRTFERLVGLRGGTLVLQDDLVNRSLTLQEVEAVRALNAAFAQAGLGRALHSEVVNFGATEYLKRQHPEPGTTRAELPAWAAPRVAAIAREIAAGIAASGVHVIGDPELLTVVRAGKGPGPEGGDVPVPVAVAARLALGVAFASALPNEPAAGTRVVKPARRQRGPVRMAEPIEIARVPTRRLVGELMVRGRAAALPGRHRAGSAGDAG